MKNLKSRAFSLIELSIVLLIIGILIAGVTQSSRLISQMRLTSARTQTESSNVASIKNLVLWLETTSQSSFIDSSTEDDVNIDTDLSSDNIWYDLNPQSSQKANASSAVGPDYVSNCINNIPCIDFNGSNEFLDISQTNGTSSAISIFVVFRSNALPGTGNIDSLLAVADDHDDATNSFQLNVDDDHVSYDHFVSTTQTNLDTAAITANTAYIVDVIDNGTNAQAISISGSNTMTRVTGTADTTDKNLDAGLNIASWFDQSTRSQYFDGRIAEIIVFNRALKDEERDSVEAYLSRKWGINIGS